MMVSVPLICVCTVLPTYHHGAPVVNYRCTASQSGGEGGRGDERIGGKGERVGGDKSTGGRARWGGGS